MNCIITLSIHGCLSKRQGFVEGYTQELAQSVLHWRNMSYIKVTFFVQWSAYWRKYHECKWWLIKMEIFHKDCLCELWDHDILLWFIGSCKKRATSMSENWADKHWKGMFSIALEQGKVECTTGVMLALGKETRVGNEKSVLAKWSEGFVLGTSVLGRRMLACTFVQCK